MRIALVPHVGRQHSIDLARHLVAEARDHGVDVVVSPDAAHTLEVAPTAFETDSDIDLVVAIGGDGTVLKAVRIGRGSGAPIFGIKRRPPRVSGRGSPARPTGHRRTADLRRLVHVGTNVAGRIRGRSASGLGSQRCRDREGRKPADGAACGVHRRRTLHHLPSRRDSDRNHYRFDRIQPVGRRSLDRSRSRRAGHDPRRPPTPYSPGRWFSRPTGGFASRWSRTGRWQWAWTGSRSPRCNPGA